MSVQVADQYQIKIVWQSVRPLVAGRTYLLRGGSNELLVSVTALKYRLDENTGEHLSAKTLNAGEVGVANISTAHAISVEESKSADVDIVDLQTSELLGRGHIEFPLYRAANIRWQSLSVDKPLRAAMKQQQPRCIWFTGLSGSGKSTLANRLEKRLYECGLHTYLLDGDNLRHGLNRDLGFTESDRVENIRRVAEVAKLMIDAGLIVLASFISPFQAERQMARRLFADGEFLEVFVDAPLAECERRDVKGLYAKARGGELKNFTGIDSAYERPEHPELVVDTCGQSVDVCVEQIMNAVLPVAINK